MDGEARVKVGFFSFTEITDPSEHQSYNAWHQLDHMPEQYSIPGVVLGQRWVSTPACRSARLIDQAGLHDAHYMTLYLMSDPVADTLSRFASLGRDLRKAGRFHDARRALLSGPLSLRYCSSAPRVLVSPAAVPFRPNRGVFVIVEEMASGGTSESLAAAAQLEKVDGVAGVWVFESSPELAVQLSSGNWDPGNNRITVCYLDEDPLRVAREVCLSELANASFAGPFESITPFEWGWFGS